MGREVNIIAGATASGKSRIALERARRANGVIINADSQQVWRDLDVLTARPSADDMAVCPHKLYGFLPSDGKLDAYEWARMAAAEIKSAWASGQTPYVVGGSGFYIKALTQGFSPIPHAEPSPPDYERLQSVDPGAAAHISPRDPQRISRALGVFDHTGRRLSDWFKEPRKKPLEAEFDMEIISLPVDELNEKIAARARFMLENGAVEEVAALSSRAPADSLIFKVLGVRAIRALIAGEIDRNEALSRIVAETRRYAKRQRTFFKTQF